ncbi:uncharacterized protein LOC129950365 [Eupeodes corollae]|uniref:uncharacterized protein LOC129950365 n=1 Tax=Eupeodes corollae TaxID=290404 RepID=UPI0024901093|nr:uncharacterized protein LOC129950365 [Eupeodes corollae]
MDLWTVEQLKAELLKRGLDTNGVKAVLFDRLKESDTDFASKKGQQSNSGQQSLMNIPRGADGDSFRFSVRDVEGLISKFSGDDTKVGTSFGGGRSVGSSSGGVNGSGASSKNSGQGYGKMSRGAGSLHCFNCGSSEHQRKECRSPTKCFRCSGTGHMSNNCPSVKPKETNAFSVINLKQIYVNGIPFKALIDSGAEITLIRKDSFVKLADTDLGKEKVNLVGLGSGKHSTLGSFEANMMIDNVKLMGIMHVVPDNFIRVDAIIGRVVMAQAKVVMVDGETTFYGKEDGNFIMNIDLDEKNDIEVPIQYEPRVKELISSYTPKAVSHCPITMTIALSDETPIYSTPRRLPINEAEVVKKQVDEWSKSGIIRPSCSPFTSRVVVVKKKGGAFRVCIDYRGINARTIRDGFPIPLIEIVLDNLEDDVIFITLDLKNGFFHVPMEEGSKKFTAFATEDGEWEFNFVPFGLKNGPAVFVRFITVVFRNLVKQKILRTFIDDLIISGKSCEVAAENGLVFNWAKCKFLQRKVTFLGHVVQNGTVSPSQEKIYAVSKFPEPTNLKKVQEFLGLTGFFRRFINSYSILAKPLTDLTKKNTKFVFAAPQRQAMATLKQALTSKPVLTIFRQGVYSEVHTDASQEGIGAILLQRSEDNQLHPVFYYSRKNSLSEQKWHSFVLETYAVYKELEKFRIYLLGTKFKVLTDCIAFRQTVNKKELPNAVKRWVLYMQDYDYEVEHRAGSRMAHVDSLSRSPAVFAVQQELLVRIQRAQNADSFIQAIKEVLKVKKYDDFGMREFYISQLKEKVQRRINNCVKCILANRKAGKQEGFLNQLDKGDKPFDTFHLDHIGPMDLTTKQYKYILTITDGFSKFMWIFPTKTVSAEETLRKIRELQQHFGNPKRFITDKGSAFCSKSFQDFCIDENIEHIAVTTGVPRGNGQAERSNRVVIEVLRRLSADSPEKWYKFVSRVQIAINSTLQRSIQRTPFEVLFGVPMRKKADVEVLEMVRLQLLKQHDDDREEIRFEVRQQIEKVQAENRKTFNRKRKEAVEYNIGDIVAIKRTQFGAGNKLFSDFLGPYSVVSKGRGGRYTVKKVADHEGPNNTTISCDYMKPWRIDSRLDVESDHSSEADEMQDGRM